MGWRATVDECAEALGGQTVRRRLRHSRLEALVDGFPVEVGYVGTEGGGTTFAVFLSGWPTTTGLHLNKTRWRVAKLGGRRVTFDDDPNWDKDFAVRAIDPDMVRLMLTRERRDAIANWFSENPLPMKRTWISKGRINSIHDHKLLPKDIQENLRRLTDLARIIAP